MAAGFHATEVSTARQDDLLITFLGAPSVEDQDFYLMLQHKLEYDRQDVALGMDKPYIEFCGQGWSWYGHIAGFRLLRDRVQVQMDKEAAREMSNDGELVITFSVDDQDFQNLRSALGTTFSGQPYFSDEA